MSSEINLFEKYGDLYAEQLRIEQEAQEAAREMLQKTINKALADGELDATTTGKKIIRHAWDTCRAAVASVVDRATEKKKGVVPSYVPFLQKLLTAYPSKESKENFVDACTLATLSTCLSAVLDTSGQFSLSKAAAKIGRTITDEASIEKYAREAGDVDASIKGLSVDTLRKNMEAGLAKRIWESYRRVYLIHTMQKTGVEPFRADTASKVQLGAAFIKSVVEVSGLFILSPDEASGLVTISASDWLEKTWEQNNAALLENAHKFIPTIIPPQPWTSPYKGGYYGALRQYTSLLRLHGGGHNRFMSSYKRKLATVDLSLIFEALNGIQETPFRINKTLLSIAGDIMNAGGDLGGLPRTEPLETLPRLPETATPEELKAHKRQAVNIIKREAARKTKALRAQMTLAAARKFEQYDKIYFPWNMDYRGRLYPIPTAIHPQGDDLQKALLEFADPDPVQDADAWKWLAIHGANCAGVDKVTFAERVAWVKSNEENIKNSARDPLGYRWWHEVSENDYPLEFLAFCLEWARLTKYQAEHNTCVGFKCHIPIAFDGTCSGLQHFSAILRDEIGGHAVNLTPSGKVEDIYSIVAEKVNEVLIKDAGSGTPDEEKTDKKTGKVITDTEGNARIKYGTRSLAQAWVTFNRVKFGKDGITRKVCKRSVMTLAYGSGQYGFKENLINDIMKPFNADHPDDTPFTTNMTQAAVYMAKLIWDAVKGTVVKAVEGMAYLQKLAKLICRDGNVVTWTTPDGLPVQQSYMEHEQKIINLRIAGRMMRIYYMQDKGTVANRLQEQGISPNFIHSRDACHMRAVIRACLHKGLKNFEMIHDSFSTDLANAGTLFTTIREAFVDLYGGEADALGDFLSDVQYAIPENEELPEKPTFGHLDIENVLKSDYCFA